MLEKTFQKKVLAKLRLLAASWVVKLNDATTIGLPDIFLVVGSKAFAIELKTKSKLSEIQFATLQKMERAGIETFVATPANFNEILVYIQGHANGTPERSQRPARFPEWVLPISIKKKIRESLKGAI